jgi:hypothetical protein
MDYIWIKNGLYMDYIWIIYGLKIDYIWIIYGLCTVMKWIICGLVSGLPGLGFRLGPFLAISWRRGSRSSPLVSRDEENFRGQIPQDLSQLG